MNQNIKLQINVQEPYFSYIKDGIKTIEGRLGKEKFLNLEIGDLVLINETLLTEVVTCNKYPSFRLMLEQEGVFNVIPDAKDIDEAEKVYYRFYDQTDELQLGVVGIGLKVLTKEVS